MDERAEFNRLCWHSRRGMLEIDVMLMPFTRNQYPLLSPQDKLIYRKLLDCEDQDIWEWLRGFKLPEDSDSARVVLLIRKAAGDIAVAGANF